MLHSNQFSVTPTVFTFAILDQTKMVSVESQTLLELNTRRVLFRITLLFRPNIAVNRIPSFLPIFTLGSILAGLFDEPQVELFTETRPQVECTETLGLVPGYNSDTFCTQSITCEITRIIWVKHKFC